jgi:glycosyltransferase involved in cell wall biosynthesis
LAGGAASAKSREKARAIARAGGRSAVRAALYNGVFLAADASGHALATKLRVLRRRGVEARVYTAHCDPRYAPVAQVASLAEARADPWRRSADVHLFDFGGAYPLFELIHELAPPARAIVTFHGLTPREYWPTAALEDYDRSLGQLAAAGKADRVLCASAYARDFLVTRGIDAARIRVVPLPVELPRVARKAHRDGPMRLLFVGRMVRSKGLPDLLEALAMLRAPDIGDWQLSIVFNPATAASGVLEQAQALATRLALAPKLRFLHGVQVRADMARLYAESAALVVPTYHDTFCLPALEALASGCPVIAYASGAVPEVTGGLAQLVPTGDIRGLAGAIRALAQARAAAGVPIAGGEVIARARFEHRARRHTRPLGEAQFAHNLIRVIGEVCGRRVGLRMRAGWPALRGIAT